MEDTEPTRESQPMPTSPRAVFQRRRPVAVSGSVRKKDYIHVRDFSFNYNPSARVLHNITMDIPENEVTAFIGPSGCGKTTLLRNFNRMNDLIDGISHEGTITVDGQDIFDPDLEVISLRKRIGMVFQKSNPFPKSIYENVVYSLRVAGQRKREILDEVVERSLKGAALWDEVKTGSIRAPWAFPADSSSGCASPAPSPTSRISSSWTSPVRPSTRSPRRRWRS